ncbi:MAG: hypothetical protein ACSHWU_10355, partial [Marinicella sp.]
MKKIFIYTFIAIVLLAGSISVYYYQQYRQFLIQPVFTEMPVTLNIKAGSTYSDFINLVRENGSKSSVIN